jgi:N-formylglutamate amidohydrolase
MSADESTAQGAARYPPWVVLHIPHDATDVPATVRAQFVLDDAALRDELRRMTDHLTHALFAGAAGAASVVRAPVSRLVVDVERFTDDAREPMAARGMGAVYTVTSTLAPLRRPLTATERAALIQDYYAPHHARLEAAVADALARHGRCVVLDCHSFPSRALPYELAAPGAARPALCIGTDAFHTPASLAAAFVDAFGCEDWRVALDTPFGGALVPASRYRRDPRVQALMVEVNRALYLREEDATPLPTFATFRDALVRRCVAALVAAGSPAAREGARRAAVSGNAPPMATALPPALVAAYAETAYRVFADPPFTLRIDEPSEPLRALHAALGVRTSAFITACNPFSEALDAARNDARQRALARELARRGLSAIPGEGRHPSNGWPGEPSLLVPGLAQGEARELGERFEQHALVFCDENGVPTLLFLR